MLVLLGATGYTKMAFCLVVYNFSDQVSFNVLLQGQKMRLSHYVVLSLTLLRIRDTFTHNIHFLGGKCLHQMVS